MRSLSHPPDIKHPKMVSNMCKSTSTTISGWRWSPFVHGARGALRCHGKICVLLVNEAAGINHRTWLTSYLLSCPSGERSSKACHFPLGFESPIVNQLSITLKDVILMIRAATRHTTRINSLPALLFFAARGVRCSRDRDSSGEIS